MTIYPGGICPERARLLERLKEMLAAHANAVIKAGQTAGTGRSAEFSAFRAEMRESILPLMAAWDEYWQHLDEHGCE